MWARSGLGFAAEEVGLALHRAARLAGRKAQVKNRTDGGDLDVRPLRQQAASGYLRAARRTHPYLEFAAWAVVEPFDDGRPVSGFLHDASRLKSTVSAAPNTYQL